MTTEGEGEGGSNCWESGDGERCWRQASAQRHLGGAGVTVRTRLTMTATPLTPGDRPPPTRGSMSSESRGSPGIFLVFLFIVLLTYIPISHPLIVDLREFCGLIYVNLYIFYSLIIIR